MNRTSAGTGWRIDQAEMFQFIVRASLSLVAAGQHRPHRVAVAQEGAGAGDDEVALVEPLAHLDQRAGGEPGLDLARLDAVGAHDLHGRAVRAVEDGRGRHGEARAVGRDDDAAREGADAQAGIVAEEDAHAAEPGRLVDLRRDEAHGAARPRRDRRPPRAPPDRP